MSAISTIKSSVSDSPILAENDILGNDKYATGLMRFIRASDTPITVGIQGGWGSGKTSLINILRHHLDQQNDTISEFVNAWEHSLFQNENDKSSVAINLLSGVVDAICQAIEEKSEPQKLEKIGSALSSSIFQSESSAEKAWTISDAIRKKALREGSVVKKMGHFAVGLATLGVKVGARTLADFETDDLKSGKDVQGDARQVTSSKLIQQLRRDLTLAVNTITQETQYKRFVCFIDDLDRVHPKTAVEILDVLKNVFDIPNCVFILAIDYEVVVKGLQEKFGEKTQENEREFRQYFDKIIQVPFSMPISAYRDKIDSFLRAQFQILGLTDSNTETIAQMAWLATDGVPRGIKRIVNTLSLLKQINAVDAASEQESPQALQILFAVVALQINFPEIYQRLSQDSRFDRWTVNKLKSKWDLDTADFEGEEIDFDSLADDHESLFDDPWEQVLYLLCQENSWLQRKARDISTFLNYLKDIIEENNSTGWKYLADALNALHVTDVDVPAAQQSENDGSRAGSVIKTDQVTRFMREIHRHLKANVKKVGIDMDGLDPDMYAKRERGKKRAYVIGVSNPDEINFLDITLFPDGALKAYATLSAPGRAIPFRKHMERWAQENTEWVGVDKNFYEYEISGNFTQEALTDESACTAAENLSVALQSLLQGIKSFRG